MDSSTAGCGEDRNKIIKARKPKDVAEGGLYSGRGLVLSMLTDSCLMGPQQSDTTVESFEPDDLKHSFQTFVLALEMNEMPVLSLGKDLRREAEETVKTGCDTKGWLCKMHQKNKA